MDAETLGLLVPIFAVLLIFGIPILAIWTKHQQKMAQMQVASTAEKAAQYASQNRELEERVRVLERIVTDKGYDVGRQIEALRDTRSVEDRSIGGWHDGVVGAGKRHDGGDRDA